MKSGRHSKYPSSLAGGISRGFAARKVPLTILLAASPPKLYFAPRFAAKTLFRARLHSTIPPATQAIKNVPTIFFRRCSVLTIACFFV